MASGLWYSDDGLTGWKQVKKASGASVDFDTATVSSKPNQIGGIYYVATSKGLWWSADGITDWTQATGTDFTTANLTAPPIEVGNTYYVGVYGNTASDKEGLWKTTVAGGKTGWTQETGTNAIAAGKKLKAPITKLQTYGKDGQPTKTEYFAEAENEGIYQSTDLNNWSQQVPTIHGASSSVAPMEYTASSHATGGDANATIWYMPTKNQGLWTSQDAGASWQQFGGYPQLKSYFPTDSYVTATPKVIPVKASFGGKMITENRLYVPTNKGLYYGLDGHGYDTSYYNEWTPAKGFPTATKADPSAATNLSSTPVNLGTPDKPFFVLGANPGGLWTSTDGINWTVNNSIPHSRTKNTSFASSATKIKSTDGSYTYLIASEAAGGLWAIKPIKN